MGAALKIQAAWRKCISDPGYRMCRMRLRTDFHTLDDADAVQTQIEGLLESLVKSDTYRAFESGLTRIFGELAPDSEDIFKSHCISAVNKAVGYNVVSAHT